MYSHVLVAYDKSEPSRHALTEALNLVKGLDAQVTVIYVADVPDVKGTVDSATAALSDLNQDGEVNEVDAQIAYYDEQKQAVTEDIADIVGDSDQVKVLATSGKASTAILELAESSNFDVLIMGARKLGFFEHILGSVSSAVLKESKIPVLIVK